MRRSHMRVSTAAALAACTIGGLSACSAVGRKTFEDDAEVPRRIASIRLDNRDGNVKVDSSADVSTISVHRRVHYRGDKRVVPPSTSRTASSRSPAVARTAVSTTSSKCPPVSR